MVLSDIEIANSVQMKPIMEIAAELGLTEDDISLYGKYKAKIDSNQLEQLKDKEDGKLILVTAISPTPVSYTHLDVYKRQLLARSSNCATSARTNQKNSTA